MGSLQVYRRRCDDDLVDHRPKTNPAHIACMKQHNLVPRLPHSGMKTLKLCGQREPGNEAKSNMHCTGLER